MDQTKLNPELESLVVDNKLSDEKINELVFLKETVDRLATTRYASEETVANIVKKFGVEPDIITWGDYFQTEVASQHCHRSDKEFNLICQTIYFDLISSVLIFSGKPDVFFDQIDDEATLVQQRSRESWTLEDEEKVHLQILANYFREMMLKENRLSDQDYDWFHGFAAARAVS